MQREKPFAAYFLKKMFFEQPYNGHSGIATAYPSFNHWKCRINEQQKEYCITI